MMIRLPRPWPTAPALVLALGVSLALPAGIAWAQTEGETQVIIIVGTRPTNPFHWGPFQFYTRLPFNLGGWRTEDEMLDARSECIAMGWPWPKNKNAISAALHDVRCNPMTAGSQAASITSRDLDEVKRTAALAMFHHARAVAPTSASGRTFQAMLADGGTSTYPVVPGGIGSVSLGPVAISESIRSGVPEPSPNCPSSS